MTNVQNIEQRQKRPTGIAGLPEGLQNYIAKRAKQNTASACSPQKTATLSADIDKAMHVAAEIAGVTVRTLTSRNRWERPCMMRQIAAYWLHVVKGYTEREIGTQFCRDRSSIYHAVERITGLLAIGDKRTTELWNEFNERITNYKTNTIKTMGVSHDLEGMPEWQKKREYLSRLLTNLTFEVADVLETLFVEMEEMNRECGYKLRQEEKRHFTAAMHHVKAFRGATRALDADSQQSFGDDAEILLDLIYAAVTRTGTDDQIMYRFLNYIMSFPDRVGLDGVRKGGEQFEAIKMQMAKERIERKTKSDEQPENDTRD